jgi:hypothetical protein
MEINMSKFIKILGSVAITSVLVSPAFSDECYGMSKENKEITDPRCPKEISQEDMFNGGSVVRKLFVGVNLGELDKTKTWLDESTRQGIRKAIGLGTKFVLIGATDRLCDYRIKKAATSSEVHCISLQRK